MNNLNSILIEGNMIRDPRFRHTPKGTAVCVMAIASNRFFKSKECDGIEKEVSFFDIEAWGKLAEACNARGKKGRGVRIVGRIKQERWNDAEGKSHARVVIVAEHVEFRPEFTKGTSEEVTVHDDEEYEGNPDAFTIEQQVEAELATA